MEDKDKLMACARELAALPKNAPIADPDGRLCVGILNKNSAALVNAFDIEVFISRRALKHIVDRRADEWRVVVSKMTETLLSPDKIADNAGKRPNSFLFAKETGKIHGVVLEILKNLGKNEVVTSYMIDKKTFKKIKDIAGGSDVPSSAP
jgi:hypothetical protein